LLQQQLIFEEWKRKKLFSKHTIDKFEPLNAPIYSHTLGRQLLHYFYKKLGDKPHPHMESMLQICFEN
jgi:hypothetical protein